MACATDTPGTGSASAVLTVPSPHVKTSKRPDGDAAGPFSNIHHLVPPAGAPVVSSAPLQYVADDRRLLQAKALNFGAVNEVDLEDDVPGFTLLLAAGPLPGVGCCVHAAIWASACLSASRSTWSMPPHTRGSRQW